jgi:PHP family Zn ribbon phosphoesterase
MKFFADFNIHSKYSRGTHPDMEIPTLAKWAKLKGLGLLGTGDFTHPQWLVELKKFLKPSSGRGVYEFEDVRFLLTTELVCVYSRGGRTYKINHLVFAPHFSGADKIIDALEHIGDLETEARPSVNLSAEDLVKTVLSASPEALVVPAHAWGLHHSLFSPQFGYNSLIDAYGEQANRVPILETGLCSDPALCRQWKGLDGRTLISNSDAHKPSELGREANLFDCPLDYRDITTSLVKGDRSRFLGTLEMFPEEDRYHGSGHRACRSMADGKKKDCPVCGNLYSVGVLDRVCSLRDRSPQEAALEAEPFHRIISLQNIIADALGFQSDAESVQKMYLGIVTHEGPELDILVHWTEDQLRQGLPPRVAEGVLALRRGAVGIDPGYDGASGRVRVRFPEMSSANLKQRTFF